MRSSVGLEGYFNDDRCFGFRRHRHPRLFDRPAPLTNGRSDQCHENHMEADPRGLSRRRSRPRLHGFRRAGGHRTSPSSRTGSRTWTLGLDADGNTARTGRRPRDKRSSSGKGQGRAVPDSSVPQGPCPPDPCTGGQAKTVRSETASRLSEVRFSRGPRAQRAPVVRTNGSGEHAARPSKMRPRASHLHARSLVVAYRHRLDRRPKFDRPRPEATRVRPLMPLRVSGTGSGAQTKNRSTGSSHANCSTSQQSVKRGTRGSRNNSQSRPFRE
jgi:hypothetical protein